MLNKETLNKPITSVGLILTLLSLVNPQTSAIKRENEMVERANEVLSKARKAVYKRIRPDEVRGLRLSSVTNRFDRMVNQNGRGKEFDVAKQILEENLDLKDEDYFKVSRTEYADGAAKDRNSTTIVSTVNGNKSSTEFKFVSNGVTADELLSSGKVPAKIKKQMQRSFDGIKQVPKSEIQRALWMSLYPLLLKSPWKTGESFSYVGKAVSDEIRADIIELISEKSKRIRFFFNEETHLLLMITVEETADGSVSKTTNYYSDYQEMDGIFVARKIVSDSETSILVESEFLGQQIYPRTTTRIKERIVLEFVVNPVFSAQTFEVNGRKR